MDKSYLKQIIANQFQVNTLLALVDDNARQDGDLTKLISQFEDLKKVNLINHPLYNQYTMISSLYTFIALPKEVIWDSIPKEITINELSEGWGFRSGWKVNGENVDTVKFRYLIRRLRNGISHGNISCDEKLIFTITDIKPNDSNDTDDFEIDSKSLDKFTRALGFFIMTDDINLTNL